MSPDRLPLLADPAVRSAVGRELGYEIEHHERIGSTQDRARELAEAGRSGLVVAEEQTAGRGRSGSAWLAPRGEALLASWSLRPLPADPALFSLLAGVAVARALAALGVADARLKWPNDVQLGGKKVAGTLADAITAADGGALVLGIGVNVRQRHAGLGDLAETATSLALEGHEIDRLALLVRIASELVRLQSGGSERQGALEDWRSRSSILGKEVEVRARSGGSLRGRAAGLADDGALLVETAAGTQRIVAGEVALLR